MRLTIPLLAALLPLPAMAQQCGPTADVEHVLRGQYEETVQGYGIDAGGTLLHVWANLTTGTWTITASNAAGLTCIIGAGDSYAAVNEPQGVDG